MMELTIRATIAAGVGATNPKCPIFLQHIQIINEIQINNIIELNESEC